MGKRMNLLLLSFVLVATFSFASAETWKYNYLDGGEEFEYGGNCTIDVNNTQYFQGYTPSSLYSYYKDMFDLVYCKLTGCTMAGDINMGGNDIYGVDALTVGGTTNLTGTTWMTTGNTFVRDSADQTHHLNVDLENLDELGANVFLTPLIIETFSNATGDYINITSTDAASMTVNLQSGGYAQNYRLAYTNKILELTAGTNATPVLNRVYVYMNAGTPTWAVSVTEPTVSHAMVSRILLGATGTTPYSASLQEDGYGGFIKRVQRVNRKRGLLYGDGFDYVASATDIQINNGTFINGIYDSDFLGPINLTEGFYLVQSDGDYEWYNSYSDILEYSDGTPIGNNKYFNVILGITPYDGTGNIYAVVQSEPASGDYTSVVDAYGDNDNTLSIYPSEEFLKIFFLPIARVVVNQGGDAQLLPNGYYAADYRGGVAGGVASGGGLSETDPIWTVDKPDYALLTDLNVDNGTSAGQMTFWNGTTWTPTATSELFWDDTNKRVGIGTASPGYPLEVVGNIYSNNFKEVATQNLFIGTNAGNTDLTGDYNSGVGYGALGVLTSGQYNMAFGRFAGRRMTEGQSNMLIGYGTGEDLTSGSNNVAIGTEALANNIAGTNNIGIGLQSFKTTTTGINNIGIGSKTGYSVTSGINNIFIGNQAGYRQTTASNLLIIDNQQRADAATEATNAILYGTMASTPASQSLRINADTGINSNPLNALDVSGGQVIGSSYAGVNTAPTDGLLVEGNVGIGTDSPSEKLHVNGTALIDGDLNVTGVIYTDNIYAGMWYHNHTATELNFATDGLYYPLFFSNATHTNGFTSSIGFGTNSTLTAGTAGLYQASYMSSGDGQNNHQYYTSIFINETNQDNCESHHKMAAGGDIITQSGNCFINLEVGDEVSLRTADIGGTGTGNYYSANINLVRIGN